MATGKLPIIIEEFEEYTPIYIKEFIEYTPIWITMSTCNHWLALQTLLGSQPVNMPKNLPDHWTPSFADLLEGLVE